jgi:hypothetical protein
MQTYATSRYTIFKAETAGSKDVAGGLRHLHYPKVLERVEIS